jgi:LAS superfamily LD-carboxypeptidase LdcB
MRNFVQLCLISLLILAGCSIKQPDDPGNDPVKGTYQFVEETEGNLALVDDAMRVLVYQEFIRVFKLSKDPHYLYRSITILINKQFGLPHDFVPKNLVKAEMLLSPRSNYPYVRKDAHDALKIMFDAALEDGIELWFHSGYRSYNAQKLIYDSYVLRYGQAKADIFSAKPGHSEHQLGLAIDIGTPNVSQGQFSSMFGKSKEGRWVAEHVHLYGFIVRYPEDKTEITGYMYEPWHIRYVGIELAAILFESGKVMEELDD